MRQRTFQIDGATYRSGWTAAQQWHRFVSSMREKKEESNARRIEELENDTTSHSNAEENKTAFKSEAGGGNPAKHFHQFSELAAEIRL